MANGTNKFSIKETNFKESCIHTRQLLSMIDVDRNDLRFSFFKRHTKSCGVCQQKLKEIEKSLLRLEFYIPKPQANLDLKNEFSSELTQLLDNLNLSARAQQNRAKIHLVQRITQVMTDIEAVFSDKKFIFTTAFIIGSVVAFSLWSK